MRDMVRRNDDLPDLFFLQLFYGAAREGKLGQPLCRGNKFVYNTISNGDTVASDVITYCLKVLLTLS